MSCAAALQFAFAPGLVSYAVNRYLAAAVLYGLEPIIQLLPT